MSKRDQLIPIDEYEGPSKGEILNFILDHMLGIDELLLPGFKIWDQRKRNIASIEEGGYESALFHRLSDAMGEGYYLVPSGSNFEGLSLPHLNFKEIKEDSSRSDANLAEAHAWVSDIDFMCVLTDIEVFDSLAQFRQTCHEALGQKKADETCRMDKIPLEATNVKISHAIMDEICIQQDKLRDDEGLVAGNNTDASVVDSKPSREKNIATKCVMKATNAPGYVTLRYLNKESTTWQKGLQVHDGAQYFSSFKFIQEMNRRASNFCNVSASEEISSITVHGPAFQFTKLAPGDEPVSHEAQNFLNKAILGVDIVWSLECRSWPSQGRAWANRDRSWPSQEIIDDIVQSGCHLVPVASKQSCLPQLEWRLSFSKAEKKLAKLLSNLQRKVYLITKALHYTHLKAFGVLSTYLLKTALFWHCEREYLEVWKQGEIGSCFLSYVELLVSYLEERNWPHYFIPENNLIGHLDADNIQRLLAVLKKIHKKPLKVLQECQNILVSHFYDEDAKSFDVKFSPILSELKSQDVKISAEAFHDTLWETGNFYLFSQGLEQALHFYKLSTVYLKWMEGDTQSDVLQLVKEYALTCGDLDEAIRCSEELVNLIKASDGNRSLDVATDIAVAGKESEEVPRSSLQTELDEQTEVQGSKTRIRSNPAKCWSVNLAGRESKADEWNQCIERAGGEQGGQQVNFHMGISEQKTSKKEEGACNHFTIEAGSQVRDKESEDTSQVEIHEQREEPLESEMGSLQQAEAEGKEGATENEATISNSDCKINERIRGPIGSEGTEDDKGKGQMGFKMGSLQQAAAEEKEGSTQYVAIIIDADSEVKDRMTECISQERTEDDKGKRQISCCQQDAMGHFQQDAAEGGQAFSERGSPSSDADTRIIDVETEEISRIGELSAALGDLGWLYQIRATQKSTEDEKRLWLARAETCFQEALSRGSSLTLMAEYGNFFLREDKPKDGARVLTIGVENDDMMKQKSYVYFNDIEKCILDTGVTDILANEGNLAFPTSLYCLYLLMKAYLAFDVSNAMKYLKSLEIRSYDVDDDEIGKRGALCLLKQGFLACGLQLQANDVQTRIDILLNDEDDSETANNEGEAERSNMVDLSECNDLVRFHIGNYEQPCLYFED